MALEKQYYSSVFAIRIFEKNFKLPFYVFSFKRKRPPPKKSKFAQKFLLQNSNFSLFQIKIIAIKIFASYSSVSFYEWPSITKLQGKFSHLIQCSIYVIVFCNFLYYVIVISLYLLQKYECLIDCCYFGEFNLKPTSGS